MADVSLKNIFKYTLPIIATSFLQQLFNSADSAVVGRFVSSQALAAVGGNASVISLLINLFNGLAIGANVVVARYLGEKNDEKISSAVISVFLMGLGCGILVAFLGIFVARPLLTFIGSPSDVIDLATTYLRIYFAGMPFIMIFNFGSAILKSNGETKKPLIALAFSGIVNVGLNIFFVVALKMSVVGVGLATVISNAISAAFVVYFLVNRNDVLKLKFRDCKISFEAMVSSLKVGLPAGLQGTIFAISNVTILSAINSFGSKAVAGATSAQMFEFFSYYITNAFSQAAVSLVSHNYGAKNLDTCIKAYKNVLLLSALAEIGFDLLIFLFRYPLLSIFTADPEVVDFALSKLYISVCLHFMICFYEISGGCLRGYGKSAIPAALSLIFCCGIRLMWVFFVLPLHRTFSFLFLAYPVSWLFCSIAVTSAYHIELKKTSIKK